MRLLVSGCTATLRRVRDANRDVLGMLLTPSLGNSPASCVESDLPWAVDNGAFAGFDAAGFRRLACRVAGLPRCLFVVAPDVVADAAATLSLWPQWSAEVRRLCGQPVAFVGQDGAETVGVPWGECDAYFVGGSTAWKLSPASVGLVAEAKRRGKWAHVGRVNSRRWLRLAYDMGADSVDGTGMSRWGDHHLARSCAWSRALRAQPALFRGPAALTEGRP